MAEREEREVVEVREVYRAAVRRYGALGTPEARQAWVEAHAQLAVVVNKAR